MMLKSLENATEKAAAFQLNEFAEGFLLMNAGTEDLKSALKWSASAVKLYETPGHWKTYALLRNKLGRKSDAKKVLKKTIREARESDEDIQEYRDLLNSIK